MERRTLLFVVLSLAIWYSWMLIFPPAEPEPADSDTPTALEPAPTPVAPTVPVVPEPDVPEQTRDLAKCHTRSKWSNHGGGLSGVVFDDYHAPIVVTPVYSWVLGGFGEWQPYSEPTGPAEIVTERGAAFTVGAGEVTNAPASLTPSTTGMAGGTGRVGPVQITQSLEPAGDAEVPCHFVMKVTWTNTGTASFDGPLWVASHDALPEGGGGMMARYTNQTYSVGSIDGGVWSLTEFAELQGPTLVDEGDVQWFGIMDRYFAALAVPEEPHGQLLQTRLQQGEKILDGVHFLAAESLAGGATHTETFQVYLGEKNLDRLVLVHPDLGDAVELGWFGFFARMLLWLLKLFHAGVGNWGLAIILLTVTVKVIFFPLTHSAFKSGQAMQAIQPELKAIREEFKDNQEELNRRTIELFRENKVNPVGGCFPMLIQIPVFIALYNVLLTSVELYQTEFLYLRDLSGQDPYGVLPLIVMGLMLLQQQFTPTANMDPVQARMMKLMPLIFGVFFFTFPAGLVVYIFVNTTLSVLQQWYIRRTFKTAPKTAEAGA